MAKKLLISALFFSFHVVSLLASATNEEMQPEGTNYLLDECAAPTPDSFRITSIGGSFISLAWTPAWVGATQTLSVSEKSPSGAWVVQYTIANVPGSSCTVDSLDGGKEYRFRIATKCPSGDISELTAFVDGIALIVDLTLLGRNPKNPTSTPCQGILYQEHEWVGFRIYGGGQTNMFEIRINEESESPIGFINRVSTPSAIVAVDEAGFFPTPFLPIIESVPIPFRIRHLKSNGPVDVGYVNLIVNTTNPPSLDICQVLNIISKPWNNDYIFTALTASETAPNGGGPIQGLVKGGDTPSFGVQNPFTDELRIFVSNHGVENGLTQIRLLNTNAQILISEELDILSNEVSLAVKWLPAGVYILQFENEHTIQTLKVVKSE